MDVVIRTAVTDDLEPIAEIYAHHVLTEVATFEVTPPDSDEWRRRFDAATERELPFVTAALDGKVVGYGFCAPWKTRPAYRHTVEDSVYLAPSAHGLGMGGKVLDTLRSQTDFCPCRVVVSVVFDVAALAVQPNGRRG
jgi:L-amino acid N-acyltransferase YncA